MPGLPRAPARPPRAIYTIHLLAYSKSSATPRFFVTKRSCHWNTFAVPHRRPGPGRKRTKACNPRHATSSKSWARAAGTSPPMRAVLLMTRVWTQLTAHAALQPTRAPSLAHAAGTPPPMRAVVRAYPRVHDAHLGAVYRAHRFADNPHPVFGAPQAHRRPCALSSAHTHTCMTRIWTQFTTPTPLCSQPAPRLWRAPPHKKKRCPNSQHRADLV